MVDIGKTAPTPEILNRPGDILTHCFQGRGDGLLANGSVMPEAAAPRESGVIFDVGHGCGIFSWDTAKRALEHLLSGHDQQRPRPLFNRAIVHR
jgi:dihydroorotase